MFNRIPISERSSVFRLFVGPNLTKIVILRCIEPKACQGVHTHDKRTPEELLLFESITCFFAIASVSLRNTLEILFGQLVKDERCTEEGYAM